MDLASFGFKRRLLSENYPLPKAKERKVKSKPAPMALIKWRTMLADASRKSAIKTQNPKSRKTKTECLEQQKKFEVRATYDANARMVCDKNWEDAAKAGPTSHGPPLFRRKR